MPCHFFRQICDLIVFPPARSRFPHVHFNYAESGISISKDPIFQSQFYNKSWRVWNKILSFVMALMPFLQTICRNWPTIISTLADTFLPTGSYSIYVHVQVLSCRLFACNGRRWPELHLLNVDVTQQVFKLTLDALDCLGSIISDIVQTFFIKFSRKKHCNFVDSQCCLITQSGNKKMELKRIRFARKSKKNGWKFTCSLITEQWRERNSSTWSPGKKTHIDLSCLHHIIDSLLCADNYA